MGILSITEDSEKNATEMKVFVIVMELKTFSYLKYHHNDFEIVSQKFL